MRGNLLIIGGSEARTGDMPVLTRFVELAGGSGAPIVVFTAASDIADEVWGQYQAAFSQLGATNITHVHMDSPKEGSSEKVLAPMRAASGIFITGGAQKRLMAMLRGTAVLKEIREAYRERGGCVAGTSAGASAMSQLMLAEGSSEIAPEKGAVELESGMGLAPHILVDQHFAQRARLPRLLSVIAEHPELYGIGIDEDTALLIAGGETVEVIGEGSVTVVDGRYMLSNIAEIDKHDSPSLIDVRLHILPSGTIFRGGAVDGPELAPAPVRDVFDALIEPDSSDGTVPLRESGAPPAGVQTGQKTSRPLADMH
jgi:cyanophycinase